MPAVASPETTFTGPGQRGEVLASFTTGAVAATAASTALRLLPKWVPGGAARWQRTNHRGETVTLLEGPAAVVGLSAALASSAVLDHRHRRSAVPGLVAVIGSGLAGALDDLVGATDTKGLGGHLRALARGEVTTGAIKIAGIGASGLAAAALTRPPADPRRSDGREADDPGWDRVRTNPLSVAVDGALIAGSANLVNLFDLRPGRALKVALLTGLGMALAQRSRCGPGVESTAVIGATLGLLSDDLAERAMLGDTGANALGAALAVEATRRWTPRARAAALATVLVATLASERVSFTRVIANTPVLNYLDQLGRRSADAAKGTS